LDLPIVSKLNSTTSSVSKPIQDGSNRPFLTEDAVSAFDITQHDEEGNMTNRVEDFTMSPFDLDDSLNCSDFDGEASVVQDMRTSNMTAVHGVDVDVPHTTTATIPAPVAVPAETGSTIKALAVPFSSGSPIALPPSAVPAKSNLLESLLSDTPASSFAASPPHPPAVPVKVVTAMINGRSVSPLPFKTDSITSTRPVSQHAPSADSAAPLLANSSQPISASRIPVFDGTSWKIRSGTTTPQRTETSPLRAHPSEVQLKKAVIETHATVKAPVTYALPTRKVSDAYSKEGSRTVSPTRAESLTESADTTSEASQRVVIPFEAGPEPLKTRAYVNLAAKDTPVLTGPQTAKGEVMTFDAHTGDGNGVDGESVSVSEGSHLVVDETTSSGPSSTSSTHAKMPSVGPALKLNLYGSADQIPNPLNPAFSKPNSPIACNWTPPKTDIQPVIAIVTDGKLTPSATGSRPLSAAYNRPVTVTSRPLSAAYSRPGSAKNNRPVSVGSRPMSAKGSRPLSAVHHRPLSGTYNPSRDMPGKSSLPDSHPVDSPSRPQSGHHSNPYSYDGSETLSVGELKKTFEQTPPEVRDRKKLLGGTLTPRMPVAITVPISRHDSITSDTDSPKNGLERCSSNSKIIMARTPVRNIPCAEPATEIPGGTTALPASDLDYAGYELGGQTNEEEEEIG
jgi:hypothetical protein